MEALNRFFRKLNESPISHRESPNVTKREPPVPLERFPASTSQELPQGKRIMTSLNEDIPLEASKTEKNSTDQLVPETGPLAEQRPLEKEKRTSRTRRDLTDYLNRLSDELDLISKENQRMSATMTIKKVAALEQQYQKLKKEIKQIQQSVDETRTSKAFSQLANKIDNSTQTSVQKHSAENSSKEVERLKKMLEVTS